MWRGSHQHSPRSADTDTKPSANAYSLADTDTKSHANAHSLAHTDTKPDANAQPQSDAYSNSKPNAGQD